MNAFPFVSLALIVAAPSSGQQRSAPPLAAPQDSNWLTAASAEVERAEYHFNPVRGEPEVWSAPNRAHEFRSRVSVHGLEVFPRTTSADGLGAPWKLRLRTTCFGRTDGAFELSPATLTTFGTRVELDHGHAVEWFENTTQGLEQGWTIPARPLGAGELWLGLELSGELSLRIEDGARSAVLVDPCGEVALRYRDLHVFDAAGRELPAQLRPSPQGLGLAVDDAGASYPLTVDPDLTGPQWLAEGGQVNAQLGVSVASAGDVNGDGYSDVILGGWLFDNGQTNEGCARIYLGSPSGLSTSPAWTEEGDQVEAWFGFSVGCAGDVNGDGFSDVIVGAYAFDNGQLDEGRAYVYLGSSGGLSSTPCWTMEGDEDDAWLGFSVLGAGDVNGDGFSDVAVGSPQFSGGQFDEGRAYLYLGSLSGPSTSPDWSSESDQILAYFGISVASAGDVNGDGFSDLAVGAHRLDNGQTDEGRTYLYMGSSSGLSPSPAWTAESDLPFAYSGVSTASAGDVNGDGYSDLLVGAGLLSAGQTNEGRASLYLGSASGLSTSPAWTAESNQTGAWFGTSVACAGDLNGDGYSDVIIGAPRFDNGQTNEGRAYVYMGSASGLSSSPNWTEETDQADSEFGTSVASAGDVNGDGYADLIIGAPLHDKDLTNEGSAFVYHGSASGLGTTEAWAAESNQADSFYGFSVASAGDLNGDGFSDVIVGAPRFDAGFRDEGRAFAYLGSASGLTIEPAWMAESNQQAAMFGFAVAGAGDLNGDGYSDVVVGAPRYHNVEWAEGRVFAYLGLSTGLAPNAAWTVESNQATAEFGSALDSAGDVNGDGFSDVIVGAIYYDNVEPDEGRAFVYLGSASAAAPTLAWTAESNQQFARFGSSVASAGDVNADGYSDVVVGALYFDGGEIDEGRAYVYLGSAAGLAPEAAWTAEPDLAGASFGAAVSTAGDVNGDGFSDLIVGANTYADGEANEGAAFVYHGSPAGPSENAEWTTESNQANALLGWSVATAGDVNGDGYSDVIVGVPNFDDATTNGGLVHVYHGSSSGLATTPGWLAQASIDFAYFGSAAATAGDVNGDGYSDVIVGAYGYASGQTDEGAAFVYLGNDGAGGLVKKLQQRTTGGHRPIAVVAAAGRDGRFRIRCEFPRSAAGVEWASPAAPEAWLEWEVKPVGVAFDGTDVQMGTPQALVPGGGTLTFDELAEVPDRVIGHARFAPQAFHWRARVATNNPLFPNTAWFSVQGSNLTEAKLRKTWR